MKKLSILAISVFFMNFINAQVDTTQPFKRRLPPQPLLDTNPPVKPAMVDTVRKQWADDELPRKNYNGRDSSVANWKNDTTGALNRMANDAAHSKDSMQQKKEWSKQDSLIEKNKVVEKAAQPDTTVAKPEKPMSDRVMMKDGGMIVVKKGEVMKLDKAITLPTGLIVSMEGIVKNKDGSIVQLKEGQYIEIKPVTVQPAAPKKPAGKKQPVKNKQ